MALADYVCKSCGTVTRRLIGTEETRRFCLFHMWCLDVAEPIKYMCCERRRRDSRRSWKDYAATVDRLRNE